MFTLGRSFSIQPCHNPCTRNDLILFFRATFTCPFLYLCAPFLIPSAYTIRLYKTIRNDIPMDDNFLCWNWMCCFPCTCLALTCNDKSAWCCCISITMCTAFCPMVVLQIPFFEESLVGINSDKPFEGVWHLGRICPEENEDSDASRAGNIGLCLCCLFTPCLLPISLLQLFYNCYRYESRSGYKRILTKCCFINSTFPCILLNCLGSACLESANVCKTQTSYDSLCEYIYAPSRHFSYSMGCASSHSSRRSNRHRRISYGTGGQEFNIMTRQLFPRGIDFNNQQNISFLERDCFCFYLGDCCWDYLHSISMNLVRISYQLTEPCLVIPMTFLCERSLSICFLPPIHMAVSKNDVSLVRQSILIQASMSWNGNLAIHFACSFKYREGVIVEMLKLFPDLASVRNEDNLLPLQLALRTGYGPSIIEELCLRMAPEDIYDCLQYGIYNRHLRPFLLDKNPHSFDFQLSTPFSLSTTIIAQATSFVDDTVGAMLPGNGYSGTTASTARRRPLSSTVSNVTNREKVNYELEVERVLALVKYDLPLRGNAGKSWFYILTSPSFDAEARRTIVKNVFETNPSDWSLLSFARNNFGVTALDVADKEVKPLLRQYVLFCGKYELQLSSPIYHSSDTIVLTGYDHYPSDNPSFSAESVTQTRIPTVVAPDGMVTPLCTRHHDMRRLSGVPTPYDFSSCVSICFIRLSEPTITCSYCSRHHLQADKYYYACVVCEQYVCHHCFDQMGLLKDATGGQPGEKKSIVIKFLKNESRFQNEVNVREENEFERKYVIPVLDAYSLSTSNMHLKYIKEFQKVGLTSYPHCIVMPAGEKSLQDILHIDRRAKEQSEIRSILYQICVSVGQLHRRGRVHGDLRPSNILVLEGKLVLLDLESSSSFMPPAEMAAKHCSTGYLPPELFADNGREILVKRPVTTEAVVINGLPSADSHSQLRKARRASIQQQGDHLPFLQHYGGTRVQFRHPLSGDWMLGRVLDTAKDGSYVIRDDEGVELTDVLSCDVKLLSAAAVPHKNNKYTNNTEIRNSLLIDKLLLNIRTQIEEIFGCDETEITARITDIFLDSNSNSDYVGLITKQDFWKNLHKLQIKINSKDIHSLFERFDLNADGKLEKTELFQLLGLSSDENNHIFGGENQQLLYISSNHNSFETGRPLKITSVAIDHDFRIGECVEANHMGIGKYFIATIKRKRLLGTYDLERTDGHHLSRVPCQMIRKRNRQQGIRAGGVEKAMHVERGDSRVVNAQDVGSLVEVYLKSVDRYYSGIISNKDRSGNVEVIFDNGTSDSVVLDHIHAFGTRVKGNRNKKIEIITTQPSGPEAQGSTQNELPHSKVLLNQSHSPMRTAEPVDASADRSNESHLIDSLRFNYDERVEVLTNVDAIGTTLWILAKVLSVNQDDGSCTVCYDDGEVVNRVLKDRIRSVVLPFDALAVEDVIASDLQEAREEGEGTVIPSLSYLPCLDNVDWTSCVCCNSCWQSESSRNAQLVIPGRIQSSSNVGDGSGYLPVATYHPSLATCLSCCMTTQGIDGNEHLKSHTVRSPLTPQKKRPSYVLSTNQGTNAQDQSNADEKIDDDFLPLDFAIQFTDLNMRTEINYQMNPMNEETEVDPSNIKTADVATRAPSPPSRKRIRVRLRGVLEQNKQGSFDIKYKTGDKVRKMPLKYLYTPSDRMRAQNSTEQRDRTGVSRVPHLKDLAASYGSPTKGLNDLRSGYGNMDETLLCNLMIGQRSWSPSYPSKKKMDDAGDTYVWDLTDLGDGWEFQVSLEELISERLQVVVSYTEESQNKRLILGRGSVPLTSLLRAGIGAKSTKLNIDLFGEEKGKELVGQAVVVAQLVDEFVDDVRPAEFTSPSASDDIVKDLTMARLSVQSIQLSDLKSYEQMKSSKEKSATEVVSLADTSSDFESSPRKVPFRRRKMRPEAADVDADPSSSQGFQYLPVPAHPTQDIWAIGCIFYQLCTGQNLWNLDFDENMDQESMQMVVDWATDIDLRNQKLKKISDPSARGLVSLLLAPDPSKRPANIAHVLRHPYFPKHSRELDRSPEAKASI